MFFMKEKKDFIKKMESCMDTVQNNNTMLSETLTALISTASQPPKEYQSPQQLQQTEKRRYTEEEKWKAAYALNLCTVSVSQIIEYNDLRFMDKEYESILNNLNLEQIPKDEALLDVLKQILDVIAYFRIQDKERKLLDKEYQQKMKDAIWNAAPNPSVILASGGSAGFVGLALSAAISIGTGYMNYRKEKAKINLQKERSVWELERSLMEQLHGLRRQLFETSWRLADEYQFPDALRLTEKQIRQYNEILKDDDPLRQYYRLDFIKKQYKAYPPFWYYLGAAALKVANSFSLDHEICTEYLTKAKSHFDYYFERNGEETKLMREDPVVAQCTFEYIATLTMMNEKGILIIPQDEMCSLISEKLKLAAKSSGYSFDVIQLCAMNYLAYGNTQETRAEAIRLLKMLVNEYYNVSSNAQILSMLYVKSAIDGDKSARSEYDLLIQTCPYNLELYSMPTDISNVDINALDVEFCRKQRIYLSKRYKTAIEAFLNRSETEFNEIWHKEYNVSNEVVSFFNDFASALNILLHNTGERIVKEKLGDAINNIKENENLVDFFTDNVIRSKYGFDFFVKEIISELIYTILVQLKNTTNYNSLSLMETKLETFCNKYSLISENNEIQVTSSVEKTTIESIVTGESVVKIQISKEEFEKFNRIIKEHNLDSEIIHNEKNNTKIECYHNDSSECEAYIKSLESKEIILEGRVLAIIKDKRTLQKNDIVFTTKKLYIIHEHSRKPWKIKHEIPYSEITLPKSSYQITTKDCVIYKVDKKYFDYDKLSSLFHELKVAYEKHNATIKSTDTCQSIIEYAMETCNSLLEQIELTSKKWHEIPQNDVSSHKYFSGSVAFVTETQQGVSIRVKITKGTIHTGDSIRIITSGGDQISIGTVDNMYSGELKSKISSATKGDTVTLSVSGISVSCVDVGSEVYINSTKIQ